MTFSVNFKLYLNGNINQRARPILHVKESFLVIYSVIRFYYFTMYLGMLAHKKEDKQFIMI